MRLPSISTRQRVRLCGRNHWRGLDLMSEAGSAIAAADQQNEFDSGPPYVMDSYLGGKDIPSSTGAYVHTVSMRAVLDDTNAALRLKRDLDAGALPLSAAGTAVTGSCAVADEADVDHALEAAAAAAPQWARVPLDTRLAIGAAIAEELRRHTEQLTALLVSEGQPTSLARLLISSISEVTFSAESLRWCGDQMRFDSEWHGHRRTLRRVPDGVVCINPPQNSPMANAMFGITAMLAGNAVVVRAPRGVPLAVMYAMRRVVAPVLERFQAPPGTLNALCGPPMMGQWLDSPLVDSIVFIGGSDKGLALERECVSRGKKPILELAGNDCSVVWRDADLDAALASSIEFFTQSGQICNLPNQLIVHPTIATEFLERLAEAVRNIRPGYPDDPAVVLTPVLQSDNYFHYLSDALSRGATLLAGGRRVDVDGAPSGTGLFLEPAILRVDGLEAAKACLAVQNETFIPLLPVVVPDANRTDDQMLDEVLEFVNSNKYGLRNSLWARSEVVTARFIESVTTCGQLKINSPHSGFVPLLPTHGGTGWTGGAFGEANYLMLRTTRLQGVDHVPALSHQES
ncbi:aldehyde dehydrogenase family protein [Nocardia sp. NPDC050793]|uniref:aldehyde dehydrogenase family protein n=1 Tax=Nocardia sp. NPDC050793 TaxID=3155159 RepID=UPI0033DECF42